MAENTKAVSEQTADSEKIQRHLDQQNKQYLSPKHYVAYILSGFGDTNWNSFVNKEAFYFANVFLGVSAKTWTLASTVSGILDSIDNALSGLIIDRTRTRWGRVRPYLLLTLPFWFFSAFTQWILPSGLPQSTLFVLFFLFNYVGSIANSFYNTSYQTILYNITPNVSERNRLIATDAYADLLGVWLPSLFPVFVDFLNIPTRYVYIGGAVFFIACVLIFRTFGFFTLRERMPLASRDEMKQMGLIQTFKTVGTCRPMWVLIIKNFFAVGKQTGEKVQNFFWINCMGKLSLSSISGLFTGLPSYFVLPLAPKLTKKFGLRNLAAGSYMFCGICYFIMWCVGYQPFGKDKLILNFIWIVFALTCCGAVNSIQRYCSTALNGDLYDYVEWKSGVRNEATITAAMGYMTMISSAVANILGGVIIDSIHFVQLKDITGKVIPQTDEAMLAGIWAVFALAPAIGRFMKGVTLLFFNVHGKTRETMMYELAKIRAAKTLDSEAADE
ncbi:MAG: MFS transporter [Clostridia bacterium]|nr:MFS transporter [Clostridia bacterium]